MTDSSAPSDWKGESYLIVNGAIVNVTDLCEMIGRLVIVCPVSLTGDETYMYLGVFDMAASEIM